MDTLEAIRTKRSVRQFKDEAVPQEVIEQILTAGRRAQSSQNHQPWTFVVVRDRARLKTLSECGYGAGHVAGAAFAVIIVDAANWSFDIGQAAAYLQLAAWDLGVASCLAYFGEADKVKALLNVPQEMTIEMGLSFGYAAQVVGGAKRSGRKTLESVTRWETW
jgi:nitroreductase